jgi:hypothetical protein
VLVLAIVILGENFMLHPFAGLLQPKASETVVSEKKGMRRREALKTLGVMIPAAAVIAACGQAGDESSVQSQQPLPDSHKKMPTTMAVGEEGGGKPPVTTMALGEEGAQCVTTKTACEEGGGTVPGPTTLALGEEGGGIPDLTTLALGEEGGNDSHTYRLGIAAPKEPAPSKKSRLPVCGEKGKFSTLSEEEGLVVTTMAKHEEGGSCKPKEFIL